MRFQNSQVTSPNSAATCLANIPFLLSQPVHYQNGGVIWSKGNVSISGGYFVSNEGWDDGGVIYASDESTTTLEGGDFVDNKASHGGVITAVYSSSMRVEESTFSGNVAENDGGVFSCFGGNIEVGEARKKTSTPIFFTLHRVHVLQDGCCRPAMVMQYFV